MKNKKNKRKVYCSICIILSCLPFLTGCTQAQAASTNPKNKDKVTLATVTTKVINESNNTLFQELPYKNVDNYKTSIVIDRETGVEYIRSVSTSGCTYTPRIASDKTILVDKSKIKPPEVLKPDTTEQTSK